MPLDGLFLYGICRELNDKLKTGRIEKIYQPAREQIVLTISRPGKKHRLLLNAGAENPRAHLTDTAGHNPIAPPMFCMLLRKHLEGARIIEFRQPGLERVLDLRADCRDELGQPVTKSLICEIMGRHSNIILVTRSGDTILDGIRRYSHAVSRHREVLPGRQYLPPPAQGKADPFALGEEQFRAKILAGNLDDRLAVVLQRSLDGFSIPTCREIVHLAGLDADIILDHCGEHELRTLWQALQQIVADGKENKLRATLVLNAAHEPVDFFPLAVARQTGWHYIPGGANEIADAFYTRKMERLRLEQKRKKLLAISKKETRRVKKKLALQQKSVVEADEADLFKLYGELLTSYMYLAHRGMNTIELDNFYDPEGKKVVIPLIPELTGPENAQAYFKKYNKLRNTRDTALLMAGKSREELDYLEGVAAYLNMAECAAELDEIKDELKSQGYLKEPPPVPGGRKVKDPKPASKPLRYKSSDGYIVLVGKNNRQNDIVTFKMARDEDTWLHACKIPGSHVIIRSGGREVPPRTLLEAASLAAHFSRAAQSANVPVDYTLRKNVKKPAGTRPGYVIYEKQKTVFVEPRPDAMRPDSGS